MTTTMSLGALSDPGGVRGIHARWVIEGELKLETATRLGGRSGGPVDIPVLRDAQSGCPLLTGSTLAGALRGCLTDRLAGYGKREVADVAQLFGSSRADDEGAQSPLIVFDSLGSLPSEQQVEIRDSVKIDGPRGTAEAHKKFDGEVLPAGTTFPIRLELLVPRPSTDDDKIPPPTEEQLLPLLLAALDGLSSGDIALGARRSRGMGRLAVGQWKAKRFDFSSQVGWLDWVKSDADSPLGSMKPHDSALIACGLQSAIARNLTLPADRRERVRITARLRFSGGLLVRSPARQADGPDVMHLQSAGQSVLPGTSLAGVLRNRALRIARLISDSTPGGDNFVANLFGPQLSGTSDPNFKPHASKLRISESVVDGGIRQRPTRIRIDRFTQGVFENALFDEEPEFGGQVAVTFELRDPSVGQLGLLFLLVKELLSGDIGIGGTTSVGRGVTTGTAEVEFLGGRHGRNRILLDHAKPLDGVDLEFIDAAIQAFHQQLQLANGSSK